jgi:hypothetical protein
VSAPDSGNAEASQCAPSPSGDWRRKRGETFFEFSGAQILKNNPESAQYQPGVSGGLYLITKFFSKRFMTVT